MRQKIAFPTDNGDTLSPHLGQAQYFRVLTLEDGQILSSELREKPRHRSGEQAHTHDHEAHPGPAIVSSLSDCQVLLAGGMGKPVYDRAIAAGLQVLLTRETSINAALQAYQQGRLENDLSLVHSHT